MGLRVVRRVVGFGRVTLKGRCEAAWPRTCSCPGRPACRETGSAIKRELESGFMERIWAPPFIYPSFHRPLRSKAPLFIAPSFHRPLLSKAPPFRRKRVRASRVRGPRLSKKQDLRGRVHGSGMRGLGSWFRPRLVEKQDPKTRIRL